MSHSGKAARAKGTGRTTSSGISHPAYRHGTKGVETVPVSPRTIDSSGSSSCFETKASPPSTTQSSPASGLAEPAPLSKESQRRGQPPRFSQPRLRRHASSWSMVHMAPDGRARNGSTHGARNGFHRRKRNIVGSARQRKARGDSYGAGLVLQAVPPLALARMRKADRVAPWHRRFKHWVFRTETRPSPAVPDNGKVRNTRVYGAGSRGRLRPIFPMHP